MNIKRQINKVHPFIKFDFSFSNKDINFLDTVVYKTGKQHTYLYRKSEQPESLKGSISNVKWICLVQFQKFVRKT